MFDVWSLEDDYFSDPEETNLKAPVQLFSKGGNTFSCIAQAVEMPWDANRLHKNTRVHSVRSCEQECRRYNTQHIRMIQNYNFTTHAGFMWGCIFSLFLLVLALTINFHQSVCLKLQFLNKKKEETQLKGEIEKVPRRHSLVSVLGFAHDCKCVGEIYHDSLVT